MTFPDKIQTVVHNLLGTILLAKDLRVLMPSPKPFAISTELFHWKGDVMNAGGSMTGGANKRGNQGSLFSQNQELKQLTVAFEEARSTTATSKKESTRITAKK